MTDTKPDIHTLIRQLTTSHTHAELLERDNIGTTIHTIRVDALIDQLNNLTTSSKGDAGGGSGGYESRPAASIEGLDVLIAIDLESARWVRGLGEDDAGSTKQVVSKLYGLRASVAYCGRHKAKIDKETKRVVCCPQHNIDKSIRSWHTRAAIATGWAGRSFAPNNTCLSCTKRRTLRITVEPNAAFCVACHTTWDSATIGLLGEHIRHENDDPNPEETAA